MRRLILVTFVALSVFSAMLVGGFLQATAAADDATRADERRLVDNQLRDYTRRLLATETVQLTWDDAVRAAGGQGQGARAAPIDPAWADTNLGQFLSHVIDADEMYLVSPDGALLRGWRGGQVAEPAAFQPIAPAVRRIVGAPAGDRSYNGAIAGWRQLADRPWPYDAHGRPLTRWAGEFIWHRGRPALMSVVAITPDIALPLLRRTPNHVVVLRFLDEAMLREIGAAVLLPDMRFSQVAPGGDERNAMALRGLDGRVLGWLSWQPHAVGAIVLKRTMPLLAVYLLFFVGVLVLGTLMIRQALRVARELAASEAQAHHHALHDPMLGLPNRAHVLQRLRNQLQPIEGEAVPASGEDPPAQPEVLLAYFDLDHFKAINESVGHHVGDDLLVQIIARVRERMGPADVLGRLASDEFVLMRPAAGGRDAADRLGDELMGVFAEPFAVFGHSVPVTASCGIAWAPDHGLDPKALLRSADIALFRAKQRGRARYRRFTHDMDATIRWRLDMEVELRRAIALDHLTMVYQPIVNVADGSIASFEALLRWHHRDRGEIGPGIFVPVAEQAGLMPLLGDWVLRRVFADSHDFGNAEISVNLSPLQLVARDFLPGLRAMIADEKVDPSRFAFEITEGVLLDNSERVIGLITELQDMGFRIALDDFGTGYSSLAYLRAFPFDRIKIDRSFVQGIESDVDAQSILRAIVALGRTLRMKVVAEGVETLLQQQLVHAAGCQLIQGHLYWRALTPEQVVALLATDRVQDLRMAV
ncbi:putative bifunctional diguanylate cyclase/phosphodiesterase [Novosphingobium bradum]|uniref:Bifunctional diguanylate cyclase/phosphodiesterase n=1 Tax=Novosphingobium bradum TaxID=1737444 RepID=A0ABV7IMS2_9SPHN